MATTLPAQQTVQQSSTIQSYTNDAFIDYIKDALLAKYSDHNVFTTIYKLASEYFESNKAAVETIIGSDFQKAVLKSQQNGYDLLHQFIHFLQK